MSPILCNKTSEICNVIVGSGAMYPTFRHYYETTWYNDTYSSLCSCSLKSINSDCNVFDFQLLFFYYTEGCFLNKRIESNMWNATEEHSLNNLQIFITGSNQYVNDY